MTHKRKKRINKIYVLSIIFIINLLFGAQVAIATNKYEINLSINGLPKGSGDLHINFKFFTDSGPIDHEIILTERHQERRGTFKSNSDYQKSIIDRDFYIYGMLYSNDGDRGIVGFVPLKYIRVKGGSPSISEFDNKRKKIKLSLRANYVGKVKFELNNRTCWNNSQIEKKGKAARQSYPFVNFEGFTRDNTFLTLSAIRDLVENKFINTCPTWNRIRGILREDGAQIWSQLSPTQILKVLKYLKSLHRIASSEGKWREIHKIYNEVLVSLYKQVGEVPLPNKLLVKDVVYERHLSLVSTHLENVVWRLDFLLNSYVENKDYKRVLGLFSMVNSCIKRSRKSENFVKKHYAMRKKIISIIQLTTHSAGLLVGKSKRSEIAKMLSKSDDGKQYMQDYLDFVGYVDSLSPMMLPLVHESCAYKRKTKEIIQFFNSFEEELNNIEDM